MLIHFLCCVVWRWWARTKTSNRKEKNLGGTKRPLVFFAAKWSVIVHAKIGEKEVEQKIRRKRFKCWNEEEKKQVWSPEFEKSVSLMVLYDEREEQDRRENKKNLA